MKHKISWATISICLITLTGCSSHEQTGSVVGSVVGAVVGSKFGKGTGRIGFSVAGSLLGSHIGGRIGRQMDAEDYRRAHHVLEYNRTGHTSRWHNRRTGRYYAYRPRRTYYREAIPCREFIMETYYRGHIETVTGTACRQPDGSWKMLR